MLARSHAGRRFTGVAEQPRFVGVHLRVRCRGADPQALRECIDFRQPRVVVGFGEDENRSPVVEVDDPDRVAGANLDRVDLHVSGIDPEPSPCAAVDLERRVVGDRDAPVGDAFIEQRVDIELFRANHLGRAAHLDGLCDEHDPAVSIHSEDPGLVQAGGEG